MLLEEGACYDQCVLLAKLLAFALLHFVLQGHTCLVLQARILAWIAIPSSRGSSQPGIKPRSPALQMDFLLSEPSRKLLCVNVLTILRRKWQLCEIIYYCKFRLKLKKVGKITRSFRFDLNQIPYDYTVEVTSRLRD